MESLLVNISQHISISQELEKAIKHSFKRVELKKNTVLLEIGNSCNKIFFIEKGKCATYYYQDGKEVISFLYPSGYWVTNWSGFYCQEKAEEGIKTVSEVVMYEISHSKLEEIYLKFPIMERFARKNLETQLAYTDRIYRGYSFGSPIDRYQHLIKYYPEIIQLTTLSNIASLLGISRETLSRIRSKK
jgi:CRP-like cAMP-binding protein